VLDLRHGRTDVSDEMLSGFVRPGPGLESAAVGRDEVEMRWSAGVWREFCAEPGAVARARWFTEEHCGQWQVDTRTGQVAGLIVTELVTNAVIHAQTRLVLALRLTPAYLHIAVRDGDPRPARPWEIPNPDGPGGRGLTLVRALSAGWGTSAAPNGKIIWAAVRRRAPAG
jgi:Histidine kinase-like ATPase domain